FTGNGLTVIGLHPAGTPADAVEKKIREHELPYPTFLASGDATTIAGYPAAIIPHSILVDAQGFVVHQGPRHEMHWLVDHAVRLQEMGRKPAPALDAKKWLNVPDGLTLDELKGKVVLLEFWGKWSRRSVTSLPKIEELQARYKD